MSRYDTSVDPENLSSSHGLMVDLVGRDKRVLDIGCASGYLGRVLVDRGCRVSGVEYDPDDAEQARKVLESVLVADLDTVDLPAELGTGEYDVVVLGDVLEHLKDPVRTLRQVDALLGPDGYAVISLPNVAHGDVRLALLSGRFQYSSTGLLDATHLRFFTRASVATFLEESGFVAVDFRRTTTPLFTTELQVRRDDFPAEVVAGLEGVLEAETYQFVFSAVPHRGSPTVRRVHQLALELDDERARGDRLDQEAQRLAAALAAVEGRLVEAGEREESARQETAQVARELAALEATRSVRALRVPRRGYGHLRRLVGG